MYTNYGGKVYLLCMYVDYVTHFFTNTYYQYNKLLNLRTSWYGILQFVVLHLPVMYVYTFRDVCNAYYIGF